MPREYDRSFYEALDAGALASARAIVPHLVELLHPASVVDVGCGTGAWLAAFVEQGITDVLGIDGEHVDRSLLRVPPDRVRIQQLSHGVTSERTFDLALSLEVAEHLPEAAASAFVDGLVRLAPAIAFSAAIPFQTGTHHVNEQWPDYWASKFDARGYAVVDYVRPRVWSNPLVEVWYAQNMLLFVREDAVAASAALREAVVMTRSGQLSVVHPKLYINRTDPTQASVRSLLTMLPTALRSAIARHRSAR